MDPNDIGTEALKAAKEIAKTTGQGLGIVEKFGTFVSQFIGGPLEQVSGIIEDQLKYKRWERQERLVDRANHFMAERGSRMRFRPGPLEGGNSNFY